VRLPAPAIAPVAMSPFAGSPAGSQWSVTVTDTVIHPDVDLERDAAYRLARPNRRARNVRPSSKAQAEAVAAVAEPEGVEAGFQTTYRPSRYEEGWLLSSLRQFYDQALITDVLFRVRGGKEATVYVCRADMRTGHDLLAAKVYRPRKFRILRNDHVYREGRVFLDPQGRPVQPKDQRAMRAITKKTAFGLEVEHSSWLLCEHSAMRMLRHSGAAVPEPLGAGDNAILMTYMGDETMPAPTLNEVALRPAEVAPLFREVLRNVRVMLGHELVHGDLSAYNILYWRGKITLIDLPQVVSTRNNSSAYAIFERDIARVCDYFATQGLERDPSALARQIWLQVVGVPPEALMARAAVPRAEDWD